MRKTLLSSLLGCFCFICVNMGSTGHAKELTNSKLLLVAQSKPSKIVIVDGVEYVQKVSEKSNKKNSDPAWSNQPASDPDRAINENLESFAMKGKYGAGLEVSVVNLGIGPSAEYWLTDNIVASGHLGLGSFTTYGIRGDYVFSKPLKLYRTYIAEPYVGLGYTFIKGPEESFPGGSVKTDGSGVDFHAGLFMPSQYIYKNVALRAEIAYSTATVDATATAGPTKVTVSGDYSSFGFGFGIYYFFK